MTSPVTGKVWMDRNLGATRVATSKTDYLAYGSLFQWCRGVDGHQLINWTSSTSGTPVNGTTTTLSGSTTPGHSNFITNTTSPNDWLSTQRTDGSLWWNGTAAGANNPCYTGYHVPTYAEWNNELSGIPASGQDDWLYGKLKLPLAGQRSYNASAVLSNTGINGCYWSSTAYNGTVGTYDLYFYNGQGVVTAIVARAPGFSIRCIKD